LEVQSWPLARIKVRDRIRRNLGDLDGLKASMAGRGLINPIGVTADGVLVTGERRLSAARELGWESIDVRVYRDVSDLELLDVEVEENTERKALTQGEAELRYQQRKKLLTEKDGGQGTRRDLTSAESAEVPKQERETRKKAARGTGYSHDTLNKVTKVRETAEDPEADPEVREEAQRQHDALMEGTAKADPALAAVETVKRRKQRKPKLTTGLGPGQWIEPPPPAKPEPTLSQRLVEAISKGQKLAEVAIEIQDADLDLNSDTITTLRKRLAREIKERTDLNRALKGVLDKRKSNQP